MYVCVISLPFLHHPVFFSPLCASYEYFMESKRNKSEVARVYRHKQTTLCGTSNMQFGIGGHCTLMSSNFKIFDPCQQICTYNCNTKHQICKGMFEYAPVASHNAYLEYGQDVNVFKSLIHKNLKLHSLLLYNESLHLQGQLTDVIILQLVLKKVILAIYIYLAKSF